MTELVSLRDTGLAFDPNSPEMKATAANMAKEFREGTAELRRLVKEIGEQTDRIFNAFGGQLEADDRCSNPFSVTVNYDRHRSYDHNIDHIIAHMSREAWGLIINRLGIKAVMSIKKRQEYERKLESGDLPEIHEDLIFGLICSMVSEAPNFAAEAAKEVYDWLRPSKGWGGEYKTNNAFKVGRRVILVWTISRGYGNERYRVNYNKDQHILALDSVFHLLDGKGILKEHRGPLHKAISEAQTGKGETEYFRFKCFKNGNLHLEFRRLDLVKQLNGLATGSFELGRDEDQVA